MKCVICKRTINDKFGNNPAPLFVRPNKRCCNACNKTYVLPARIEQMKLRDKYNIPYFPIDTDLEGLRDWTRFFVEQYTEDYSEYYGHSPVVLKNESLPNPFLQDTTMPVDQVDEWLRQVREVIDKSSAKELYHLIGYDYRNHWQIGAMLFFSDTDYQKYCA